MHHRLFRRKHHQHLSAFHARISLDLGYFGRIFRYALQQCHTELLVRKFAPTEPQRDLYLVTFTNNSLKSIWSMHDFRNLRHWKPSLSRRVVNFHVFTVELAPD